MKNSATMRFWIRNARSNHLAASIYAQIELFIALELNQAQDSGWQSEKGQQLHNEIFIVYYITKIFAFIINRCNFYHIMAELSPEIRNQLQKLAEKDAFVQSIDELVRAGVNALCDNGEEYSQQTCPTALLLAFSHCYSSLASELPQNIRQAFVSSCEKYAGSAPPLFQQEGVEQLIDVEWNIDICYGRQLWNITLKFESGKQIKMVLNYQQLSVLVFKLGQAVAYVQNYQI